MKVKLLAMQILFVFSFSNAQLYKGLNLTKEQKLELKEMCKAHSKIHDSIEACYNLKIKNLKDKASEEHYFINEEYMRKKDSLEKAIDNDIAKVLNDKQRIIFWERVNKKKKSR